MAAGRTFTETITFREALMPPGPPSVALRDDETAVIWNPAGMALSDIYYVGYAWRGTYFEDDRVVSTHFFLTKAKGFGVGIRRDDWYDDNEVTTFFSLAPHLSKSIGLGWTGKWRSGFNFDAGITVRLGRRIILGGVSRNIRDKEDARKYNEVGIGVSALARKLTLFFDVVDEDSPWRDELAMGGGFIVRLQYGITMTASYLDDGEDHGTIRVGLKLSGARMIEGEYSETTDDYSTLSGRLSSHNP
jgi:hypothetical protein